MTSPTSNSSEKTSSEKATQAEFDREVERMQSLIAHIQLHATNLKASEGASEGAVEKVQEVETLLEQVEELLEEAEELQA